MEEKHLLKIYRHCPKEQIFEGEMTFTEARRFMDENATSERRVNCQWYNSATSKWEDIKAIYHGGRRVYDDKGNLSIIDPDYRNMWPASRCGWYIWEVSKGRRFVISLNTKENADKVCDFYQKWYTAEGSNRKYIVEQSDVNIET